MSPSQVIDDVKSTLLGDALNEGTVLGRYRILSELGRGSMGTVYKAQDKLIERFAALKVVRRPGANSDPLELERYARFLREAKAAGGLSHSNIVTIYDVAEDAPRGVAYLGMELVTGDTLETVIRRGVQLGPRKVRSIGMQVLSALEAAHRMGIVHRDIKPANLILNEEGKVKVTDFGIAKTSNSEMTQDGVLLGSPRYMSPEQVRAAHLDHRTDLFSLGVVLYELITLRSPFTGESIYEILQNVIGGEPIPLETWRPDVQADLGDVVMRALSKDPTCRFESAEAMWVALKGSAATAARLSKPEKRPAKPAKAGRQPVAETPARRGPGRESLVKNRSLLIAGLAAVLLLAVGVGLYLARDRTAPPETPGAGAQVGAMLGSSVPSNETPAPTTGGAGENTWPQQPVVTQPTGAGEGPLPGGHPDEAASPIDEPVPVEVMATPATTPRPTPVRTPVPREVPRPVQRPIPTPAVEPAVPADGTSFPVVVSVKHRHRFGSCHGVLRIGDTSLEYDSEDRDKDDRAWDYQDLRSISFSRGGELRFTEDRRNKLALGLKRSNYNFEVLDASLPSTVLEHLKIRISNLEGEPAEGEADSSD